MALFEYLIVGSGPSGMAAARQLAGASICVLDVADNPIQEFQYSSLDSALKSGSVESVLGKQYEFLTGAIDKSRVHAKLKSESLKFVLQGESIEVFQNENLLLRTAGSFATGGMSNAWGTQLLRYTDEDFRRSNWPINLNQLVSYYADLEKHIGISGAEDDMHQFLGAGEVHMPPAPIVLSAQKLLENYKLKKAKKSSVLVLGRARLAVLTESYRGYSAHNFGQTDFFSEHQSSVYSSKRTLAELVAAKKIHYKEKFKVISFIEHDDHVEVHGLNMKDGTRETLKARHLLLGCGTAQTAKIVLLSKDGSGVKLPFIDHPPVLIPFFIPSLFGKSLAPSSYPIQLTGTMNSFAERPMISFYYPGGMIFSDLLFDLPFDWRNNLKILKLILSGLLISQIWFAAKPSKKNYLSLDQSNNIKINYDDVLIPTGLEILFAEMRMLGAYSLKRFITKSPPVWGFHHAGCLPMSEVPNSFQTHIDGRLWDSRRVRVIDGSVLPSLPSKNHSLTMMANAARIADEVLKCGY